MSGLLGAWLAEIVLISYRSAKQSAAGNGVADKPIAGIALPSEYAASFVIYGALAFVPGRGQPIATAFGWGIVVATLLNLWDPTTIGNKGGVAVVGGPSTKVTTGAPLVKPSTGVGT